MLYMVMLKIEHGVDRWMPMQSFKTNEEAYEKRDDWSSSLPGRTLKVIEYKGE